MLHSGRAETGLQSGRRRAAQFNFLSFPVKNCSCKWALKIRPENKLIDQMQMDCVCVCVCGGGAKGVDANLGFHVFWGYGRSLTCVFVCEGNECTRDVPASVKTHHFGLHVPIGRLQTRDNWRYHGNKWCCARRTRALACACRRSRADPEMKGPETRLLFNSWKHSTGL